MRPEGETETEIHGEFWRVTNNNPSGQGGWDYKLQEPTSDNLRLGLAKGTILMRINRK